MPFTSLVVNTKLSLDQKKELAAAVTQIFVDSLKTFTQHNHVRILDNEFVSFAGNYESPAVMVQVKAADNSINKEAREALVEGFSKALTSHIPCLNPDRIYITFEELPVQNIAVGNSIMRFATMHTAKSVDNIAEIQP